LSTQFCLESAAAHRQTDRQTGKTRTSASRNSAY